MVRLEYFTIGTSSRVSALCHSVVRGEVFSTCNVGCVYCYARWYRGPHGQPKAIFEVLRLLKEYAKIIQKGLPVIPIRISALSDPFQPPAKITLKVLKVAYKNRIPIIVNTKLVPSHKHFEMLKSLANEGLLVLQVSINALPKTDEIRVLEPHAPSVEDRLNFVRKASDRDIPTLVRLQPFIPGISDRDIDAFFEEISNAGARMVTVEFLRIEKAVFDFYKKMLSKYSSIYEVPWDSYLPRTPVEESPLVHPPLEYKIKVMEALNKYAKKYRVHLATCKEGLFSFHVPNDVDCCGMHFLKVSWTRRPTLWDLYKVALTKGKASAEDFKDFCEKEGLLFGKKLRQYPLWLFKSLKAHEKRLLDILERPDLVKKLAPCLTYASGYYIVNNYR